MIHDHDQSYHASDHFVFDKQFCIVLTKSKSSGLVDFEMKLCSCSLFTKKAHIRSYKIRQQFVIQSCGLIKGLHMDSVLHKVFLFVTKNITSTLTVYQNINASFWNDIIVNLSPRSIIENYLTQNHAISFPIGWMMFSNFVLNSERYVGVQKCTSKIAF